MAQKKITDLSLISAVLATLSVPTDNGSATYRFTIAQLATYLRSLFGTLSASTFASPLTLTGAEYFVTCDPTGGAYTQALPALSAVTNGTRLTFKNITTGANKVTLDGSGTETIDGALTIDLASMEAVTLIKQAAGWYII